MAKTFYVQNKKTREMLNRKGTWSKSTASYRLAEFNTAAEAESAFPQGAECRVIYGGKVGENLRNKPVESTPKIASVEVPEAAVASETKIDLKSSHAAAPKFFLRKTKLFLDNSDKFSERSMSENVARFDTLNDALDKAEALDVHLDDVTVMSCLVCPNPPKLPAGRPVR